MSLAIYANLVMHKVNIQHRIERAWIDFILILTASVSSPSFYFIFSCICQDYTLASICACPDGCKPGGGGGGGGGLSVGSVLCIL